MRNGKMAEKSGIQRQEVSTALELLIGKIEDERKRIYSDGANAMKALDADTASKVLDFAKKIEAFQGKVKQLNSDWSALVEEKVSAPQKVQDIVDGDGKLFGMRTRKSKTGFTRNVTQPMAAKTNFTVRFPDGTVIFNRKACDTLVQTIERIGEHKVQGLNLICAGEPLVSKSRSKKYPAGSKRTAAGFFIQTQSSTSAKIKYLKTISAKLKIKLTILPPETAQNDELPGFNFTPADDETLTGVSWLIPANGKLYNHEAAFDKFGYIDWKQNKYHYRKGDIVYIYCSRPIGKVRYMTIVDKTGMSFDEITDDREFWTDTAKYDSGKNGAYVRLRLLKKKDSDKVNLAGLCAHGLCKAPQGPIRVRKKLLEFLKQNFGE